jgi:hypothetical protein
MIGTSRLSFDWAGLLECIRTMQQYLRHFQVGLHQKFVANPIAIGASIVV